MADIIDTKIVSRNDAINQVQYWHEHQDGSVTLETKQDITAIAEANQMVRNTFDERANWKGDMHRVASIPMSIYYDLKAKGILDDPAAMKKWLNDPDNVVFRTRPGKV